MKKKTALVIGQTREYTEGWEAFTSEISRDANPYPLFSAAELAWRHGWEANEMLSQDSEELTEH